MTPDKPSGGFFIDLVPAVGREIRRLAVRAASRGILDKFFRSVDDILQKLSTEPLQWGDPEWDTRRKGGVVCHGILSPLVVHYVVFEAEKIVFLLRIKPVPGSSLE